MGSPAHSANRSRNCARNTPASRSTSTWSSKTAKPSFARSSAERRRDGRVVRRLRRFSARGTSPETDDGAHKVARRRKGCRSCRGLWRGGARTARRGSRPRRPRRLRRACGRGRTDSLRGRPTGLGTWRTHEWLPRSCVVPWSYRRLSSRFPRPGRAMGSAAGGEESSGDERAVTHCVVAGYAGFLLISPCRVSTFRDRNRRSCQRRSCCRPRRCVVRSRSRCSGLR
jgi:hypothetical protein